MPDLKRMAIGRVRKLLRQCVPLLRLLPGASQQEPASQPIRRILLLHPGHLGDIVISSSILQPLEEHFPGVVIGFVAGSWSAAALQGTGVQHVYRLDHWRLHRGSRTFAAKWLHFWKTRRTAIREIRSVGYDVAISLLDVNPDLLDVAWAAKIPVRVGWTGSFFAPLATRLVPNTSNSLQQQGLRQAQLALSLGVSHAELANLQSRVAPDTADSRAEVAALLGVPSLQGVRFRVIHAGAGAPLKLMPSAFWRRIAEAVVSDCVLLCTGRGAEETATATAIIHGLPNSINACGRLSWRGFVTALRAAEMLYCVDSMAGHVGAAVATPVAAAYIGANGVSRWRPLHTAATVFTNHLPCAPCYLYSGCATMPCRPLDPELLLTVQPSNTTPHADADATLLRLYRNAAS